jgi:hypothetical protein
MDLGIVGPEEIRMRPEATVEEILRVPERAYVHRFLTGSFPPQKFGRSVFHVPEPLSKGLSVPAVLSEKELVRGSLT